MCQQAASIEKNPVFDRIVMIYQSLAKKIGEERLTLFSAASGLTLCSKFVQNTLGLEFYRKWHQNFGRLKKCGWCNIHSSWSFLFLCSYLFETKSSRDTSFLVDSKCSVTYLYFLFFVVIIFVLELEVTVQYFPELFIFCSCSCS